jgi:hypothetical protein
MEANDLGHRSWNAVSKMATNGIADHLPKLFQGFALRRDGVAESGRDVPAVRFILSNFKDYLGH